VASAKYAHQVGRETLQGIRQRIAERLVDALEQRDPELLSKLSEVGVVRRSWVEDPGSGPMSEPPVEVVQRLLERSVERRPSLLASLGLSTIQLLAAGPVDPLAPQSGVVQRLVVVFTDLEGFTRFTARTGDEAAGSLLAEHHRATGPVVRSRGGRVVKRLGDGLLITFLEPEAAVLAGIELVAVEPGPLRLRVGIHLGDVMMTRDDVIGHVVNVAARVTESAKGGEVLVTTDVRREIGGGLPRVTFSRARRKTFKGLEEPVGICRATTTDVA
jgi:class 3 adenylate cyclase